MQRGARGPAVVDHHVATGHGDVRDALVDEVELRQHRDRAVDHHCESRRLAYDRLTHPRTLPERRSDVSCGLESPGWWTWYLTLVLRAPGSGASPLSRCRSRLCELDFRRRNEIQVSRVNIGLGCAPPVQQDSVREPEG